MNFSRPRFLLLLAGILVFIACSKKGEEGTAIVLPTILSISPTDAGTGDVVTITGTNFSPVAVNNNVKVDGTTVTVVAASATQLQIVIPAGLVSGTVTVTVTVDGQTGNYSFPFTKLATISTFAGSVAGYADGKGVNAAFKFPDGIAIDASGNIFVCDRSNRRIRKITPAGDVTTFAGSGAVPTTRRGTDGTGLAASFISPSCIAIDASGNLFVGDGISGDLFKIRKVTPSGVTTTLTPDFTDMTGLAFDPSGNLFILEGSMAQIWKMTPGGVFTTFAGQRGVHGWADGTGAGATFDLLAGIAIDASGNLYVTDLGPSNIRKITSSGVVTTLAGSKVGGMGVNIVGNTDGAGLVARFYSPSGLAFDGSGNLYVMDSGNSLMRKITPSGIVSTFAGKHLSNGKGIDGKTNIATFSGIGFRSTMVFDAAGNLYFSDGKFDTIRKITF
jgi:uncharacterized protein (TIGR03437 family)